MERCDDEPDLPALVGFFDDLLAALPSPRTAVERTGLPLKPPASGALEVPAEERQATLRDRWEEGGPAFLSAFTDVMTDEKANEVVAEFVRERIREIVHDPKVAALLEPRDYPIGAKRLCIDIDYFTTYNRDNVTLVSIKDNPIERITAAGVQVAGVEYEVDAIVFATGFDAITGPLNRIDITGTGGVLPRDKWREGPRTYLGLASAGFPNLTDPGRLVAP